MPVPQSRPGRLTPVTYVSQRTRMTRRVWRRASRPPRRVDGTRQVIRWPRFGDETGGW
jgi:hypothetical protein